MWSDWQLILLFGAVGFAILIAIAGICARSRRNND